MNELDVLFPSPVPLRIGDGVMRVLPLRMRWLGDLLRALVPVQGLFADGAVDLDALLQSPQALEIIRIGTGCGADSAAAMDADERRAALLVVIAQNEEVFFPPPPESGGDAFALPENPLADLLQRLVAAGHRFTDLLDYTYVQCRLFDDAAARLRRDARHDALIVGRAAVASPEVFRQVLKDSAHG